MSVTPELVGDGYTFSHRGRAYHVGLITQQVKSDFEKAIFEKEKQKLRDVREFLTQAEYESKGSFLANKYLAGGFAMFQGDDSNPLNNPESGLLLFSAMMGITEVELVSLLSVVEAREKLLPLLMMAMKDSFPGLSFEAKADQKKTIPTSSPDNAPSTPA